MHVFRLLMVFAVMLGLAFTTLADDNAQKKKKKRNRGGVVGAITQVDAGKDSVQLTVKTKNRKSGETKDVKVTVNKEGTKIEKSVGTSKEDRKTVAASISDLQVGQRVMIRTRTDQRDQAERVVLLQAKKKSS